MVGAVLVECFLFVLAAELGDQFAAEVEEEETEGEDEDDEFSHAVGDGLRGPQIEIGEGSGAPGDAIEGAGQQGVDGIAEPAPEGVGTAGDAEIDPAEPFFPVPFREESVDDPIGVAGDPVETKDAQNRREDGEALGDGRNTDDREDGGTIFRRHVSTLPQGQSEEEAARLLFDQGEDIEIGGDEEKGQGETAEDGGNGPEDDGDKKVVGDEERLDEALEKASGCGGHGAFVLSAREERSKRSLTPSTVHSVRFEQNS